MGPWSGGLGTPALDHIPIQAQLSEEKKDGLMSRKVRRRLRPSLSWASLLWAWGGVCVCGGGGSVGVCICMLLSE